MKKFPFGPGNTPLHLAAGSGADEKIQQLIQQEAKVDTLNKYLETPLFLAVKGEQLTTVRLLLAAGANIRLFNNFGLAPIHFAAGSKCPEIISVLIENGCPIDLPTSTSQATPLMLAVSRQQADNVKLMLKQGANIDCKNNNGHSAIDFALKQSDSAIADLLLFWGSELRGNVSLRPYSSLFQNYQSLRSERSIIKSLRFFNAVIRPQSDKFPSLKQIVGLQVVQQGIRSQFWKKLLPEELISYLQEAFPKKLQAGMTCDEGQKSPQASSKL